MMVEAIPILFRRLQVSDSLDTVLRTKQTFIALAECWEGIQKSIKTTCFCERMMPPPVWARHASGQLSGALAAKIR